MSKPFTSAEIRQAFLDFFEEMGHTNVPSSSLVPGNDPTLLFTNAGMVQFKDVFLGMDQRDYKRATTAQKCMRVSGKHNDLENVGPSPRHHTFFEMLGNFSFGDYFKSRACQYAYDLLTKVYQIDPERLAYTVHHDDDEAYDIWVNEVGVPAERVHRLGDKDNFWMMADVGPCGYTSEIHYDQRPEEGLASLGKSFDEDDGRFLEVWNLVFMQFEQDKDGNRTPLPAPGVDTGMGMERITAVVQGKPNNYESDLFMPIIRATQALTGHSDAERDANIVPYRVIADHMRAACFLISDGVRPGPNGRDYVCRMVMRRAMRFGTKLGFDEPFLADVADAVIDAMKDAYPELAKQRDTIRKVVTNEERRFGRAMDRGLGQLNAMLDALPDQGELAGADAFFLHSSIGLPFEITRDVAQERGYSVDEAGFRSAQEEHTRKAGGGAFENIDRNQFYRELLDDLVSRKRLPAAGVAQDQYGDLSREASIVALIRVGEEGVQAADEVMTGERVEVVLDITPFYVESGGQVSDVGTITATDGSFVIDIEDSRRPVGGLIVHVGEVIEGQAHYARVIAAVDEAYRMDVMRNHTATHLLHEALRRRLGPHVQQRGSLVAPDRLRFDFSHDSALSTDELHDIARDINEQILLNLPVAAVWKDLEVARKEGAMALFGEKYGAEVRTITIGDGNRYSYELCGGNHVPETAVIGSFHVTSESAVAQGVRRIEAVTGREAQQFTAIRMQVLNALSKNLGVSPEDVPERVAQLQQQIRHLQGEIQHFHRQSAKLQFDQLREKNINGVTVLVSRVENVDGDTLREMMDWFREAHPERGVAVLGTVTEAQRPALVATVTKDLSNQVHAGNIIKEIAAIVDGGGGGRPNMAQAGGKNPARLDEALDRAYKLVAELLSNGSQ